MAETLKPGPSGVATLVGGSVMVPLPTVVAESKFHLTPQGALSGTLFVSAVSPGVGFTIESTNGGENVPALWTMYTP